MNKEFDELNTKLKSNPKIVGEILNSSDKVGDYVNYMLPSIAVYFVTTHGLTREIINENLAKMNLLEQLDFVLAKVRLKQFV